MRTADWVVGGDGDGVVLVVKATERKGRRRLRRRRLRQQEQSSAQSGAGGKEEEDGEEEEDGGDEEESGVDYDATPFEPADLDDHEFQAYVKLKKWRLDRSRELELE